MSGVAKSIPMACDERRALALKVADAVTKVYDAGKQYEAAKSRKASKAGERYDSLLEARAAERNALRALRAY